MNLKYREQRDERVCMQLQKTQNEKKNEIKSNKHFGKLSHSRLLFYVSQKLKWRNLKAFLRRL